MESISKLGSINPFFGTAFLALKKEDIPIGSTRHVVFSRAVDEILQAYYRPVSVFANYYIPFRSSKSTDQWNSLRYASTTMQRIATDTFSDALIHPKGGQEWGWSKNYIRVILEQHLRSEKIPAFDLAVWIYRDREWYEGITKTAIVEHLFLEFKIRTEERVLFDLSSVNMLDFGGWLQASRISINALLDIIGEPNDSPLADSAALTSLDLIGVGPARKMSIAPASRLNLITGDNGLGKTFLLDCIWWALTGTWAAEQAYPRNINTRTQSGIEFEIKSSRRTFRFEGRYDRQRDYWASEPRGSLPGLSIYAKADGSFAVWDPAKRRLIDKEGSYEGQSEPQIVLFRDDVLYGKSEKIKGRRIAICQGLIHDWLEWQNGNDVDKRNFELFSEAIKLISPNSQETLNPGGKVQLPPDFQDMPTLQFSYGEVPFVHCSAGIQRIVALVYMLLWSWLEHVKASEYINRAPERTIVLLVDEMEAHLHPFWQRTIIPAIFSVIEALNRGVKIQSFLATHSPLVLASVEQIFAPKEDALFNLHLSKKGDVLLENIEFVKQGRIDKWLTSEAFGLAEPRSLEAERVIQEAESLQTRKSVSLADLERVTKQLFDVLGQDDQFWARWIYYARSKGVRV